MPVKIAILTGNRAEYGLLYPLIKELLNEDLFEVYLIVTGTHLSHKHGYTIEQIKDDNIPISYKVDILCDEDSEYGICKTISTGIEKISDIFNNNEFDLLIVLGDRYELLAACICAINYKVPIAHIHGGEITKGAIDDMIRHVITKMASIHFPSIEVYGKRIIQMGEHPSRVHVVGALGIDNIKSIALMSKEELSREIGINFDKDVALITYHPVTSDQYIEASQQVKEVLEAVLRTNLIGLITMPNSDCGGQAIFNTISKYINRYPQRLKMVKSLGTRKYLSAMKHAKMMIGNSSSGIIESASFCLPVINIGDRQEGRYKCANVIDCNCSKEDILFSIQKALAIEFIDSISQLKNPYGDGNTAKHIVQVLKTIDFSNKKALLKKGFCDL